MLPFYILLTCLSSYAWGRPTDPSEFCFGGCELALGSFQFNETSTSGSTPADPSTLHAKNGCNNGLQVPSLYLCLKIYCTAGERARGLDGMNETCQRGSNITIPPYSIVDGYSDEDIDGLRHLQPEEIPRGGDFILNEVSIPSKQVFKLAFDTLDAVYFETRIHNIYGCAMYYFWVVVIAIGLSSHLGPYSLTFQNRNSKWQPLPNDDADIDGTEEQIRKRKRSIFDTPYTLLKRYITVPATFGYKRSQNIGWCTIPTRVQSLAIGAFILINIVLCSCSYRVFPNNIYWPRVSDQVLRYFADRTGIISTANLPLIWLFGIRNNTLMWLTGWDFATYNNFHRWVARVSTFEAVLHSIAYTVLIVAGEGSITEAWAYYLLYYSQKYFVNGVLATIFMVAILVASVYPLRRNFYEMFLWLHIILSILVIITMYYHVEIFHGYTLYIYPCILIWLLDRLLRLLRILTFNNPQFWRNNPTTKATITYSPSSNIVRLTVPYNPTTTSFNIPRPGTFYYIYVVDSWRFWENHPFTLGYVTPTSTTAESQIPEGKFIHSSPHSSSMSLGTISPPRRAPSPQHPSFSEPTSSLSTNFPPESAHLLPQSPLPSPPPLTTSSNRAPDSSTLTFLIRPYNGFTSRLRSSCLSSPSHAHSPSPSHSQSYTTTHTILLEGPYGTPQPLHTYTNILFIVGGTGIAVPLSYLRTLTSPPSPTNGIDQEATRRRTKIVTIVWAVREKVFLDEVVGRDFPAAGGGGAAASDPLQVESSGGEVEGMMNGGEVKLQAYITQSPSSPSPSPCPSPSHLPSSTHFPNTNFDEDEDKNDNNTSSPSPSPSPDTNAAIHSTRQLQPPNVKISTGRPDVFEEVSTAVAEAAGGDLAVVACGPGMMADDARRAVVTMLGRGVSGIEYFEESFNW
ncbi:ferric reductase like transmembrane component-domain-containing protein [Cadophora sp. MPI-SDFR-AT-0126]|nr:ferric reductase like transmembrane component-domain-containing protein [Leotiomycetes sp. MPI-SDFR-AT-0126]